MNNIRLNISLVVFFGVLLIGLGFPLALSAQDQNTVEQDSLKNDLPYGEDMNLGTPNNIEEKVDYDSEKEEYEVKKQAGEILIQEPRYYTEEEYRAYRFQKQIDDYWRRRVENPESLDEGGAIPTLNFGGKVVNRIFGGNSVDITPQGTAELIFSGVINTREDPSLPESQRSVTNFQFDQRIQMNVIGKIGDKLQVRTNYDTEATFDFENQMKLEYTGYDDEIIKKVELGNVSLPLPGTLITGTQSLFGIKTQLQFGRTTVTAVFSEQRSETSNIQVQGGAQTNQFNFFADQYEANKHYFLSEYFYDNYDNALSQMPTINSPVRITRVEVWVTNRRANVENTRNVLALMDLGDNASSIDFGFEADGVTPRDPNVFNGSAVVPYPSNTNNTLEPLLLTQQYPELRNLFKVTETMQTVPSADNPLLPIEDFEKIENARKLTPSEFTINNELGFISLNQRMQNGDVLAVAYEYTVNGQRFQVGEFSNEVAAPDVLVLKLIQGVTTNVELPTWKLMMKNVYSLSAYQVEQEDFILDIMYQNDNTGAPINFIPEPGLADKQIIQLMNLDTLNANNDLGSDGIFDFISNPPLTINPSNGRIYIPATEPFGSYLRSKFEEAGLPDEVADKYIYESLYSSTQADAIQDAEFNKFLIKGSYKSSGGAEIPLNALNVPQGSVTVTAGGEKLVENIHYTVDYNLGRVRIIDEGYLNSGTPLNITLENNSLFNFQAKTYMGMHVDYQVSDDFLIGGTILNLNERPLTNKINIGDEPISNTIWGLNATYSTKSNFLTNLIDKIPFIETKEESEIIFTGEFAHFIPGHPEVINSGDEQGTAYLDDFENSQNRISLGQFQNWTLASTPQFFPESQFTNDIRNGFNRAKIAWYQIDNLFQVSQSLTPSHIRSDDEQRELPEVRFVNIREIYQNRDIPSGQPERIQTFDIAYYPEERGAYNFDVEGEPAISSGLNEDGSLRNPQERWGGVMREIQTNDFEAANIEFIEFWMMDPYTNKPEHEGGNMYINIGNISEDILKDSRKSFENGLSPDGTDLNVDTTAWGRVPAIQSPVNAFDNDGAARVNQDIGLDGLRDDAEREFVPASGAIQESYLDRLIANFGATSQAYSLAVEDPSADNFHYYLGGDYDEIELSILERYKKYNGFDGNSPLESAFSGSNRPDLEDINNDLTLNEFESYYQYEISLRPSDLTIDNEFITDVIEGTGPNQDTRWLQFKVPIRSFSSAVGNINDFKSIRFMRIFYNDFTEPVVTRFATMDLVRGEWRRYIEALDDDIPTSSSSLDVSVVNIEENGKRAPIPYVLPPGIQREELQGATQLQQQNEQSIALRVCDLENNESKGAFKNISMDMRTYKRLKMFTHLESLDINQPLVDGDLSMFIRLGNDNTENYYEYVIPLEVTEPGVTSARDIWPEANELDVTFSTLTDLKIKRNAAIIAGTASYIEEFSDADGANTITVKGNPNLGNVRAIMIGVRNTSGINGETRCGEVWVNELRLADFDEESGWAAKAQIKAKLADFGIVTLTGNMSTVGFGSLDQNVSQRNLNETREYNLSTSLELGKFFPEKTNLRIPMYYGVSEIVKEPKFNPLDPDVKLEDALDGLSTEAQRSELKQKTQDFTKRRSVNFTNVRKERSAGSKKKPKIYDIENFNVSYSFTETNSRDVNIDRRVVKNYTGGIGYAFNTNPKNISPLRKVSFLKKSKYLSLFRDFNFYLEPKSFSFRTDVIRDYTERKIRTATDLSSGNTALGILDPIYSKSLRLTRVYNLKYDLTRSVKFNFSANSQAFVDEVQGEAVNNNDVWNGILSLGRPTNYHHQFDVKYNLPINKFPLTDWVTVSLQYNASYDWQTASSSNISFGNTIQNTNTKRINGQLNFRTLYNKIPYFKRIDKRGRRKTSRPLLPGGGGPGARESARSGRDKANAEKEKEKEEAEKEEPEEEEDKNEDGEETKEERKKRKEALKKKKKEEREKRRKEREESGKVSVLDHFAKVLLSVKNANIVYDENNGTLLPGFLPGSGNIGVGETHDFLFFGMDHNAIGGPAPGWGFVGGSQNDIRLAAVSNGWLSKDPQLNNQYTTTYGTALNLRLTIEPISKLRVQLSAKRNYSERHTEFYRWAYSDDIRNYRFETQNEQETGNFSMSVLTFGTAFQDGRAVFNDFLNNRAAIASALAQEKGLDVSNGIPSGFGLNSQDVLIKTFMATYSGTDPSSQNLDRFPSLPMPNWTINYDGLTDIKWVKERFRSITLGSSYTSIFTMGAFSTNLLFDELENPYTPGIEDNLDINGNFITEYNIAQVSIVEAFNPLFKIDVTMKNNITTRFEYARDRSLTLSLTNNQILEDIGTTYTIGMGYRINDFKLLKKSRGKKKTPSTLDINADISIRDNASIIRSIEEDTHQATGGQRLVSIKTYADYVINERLSLKVFFDRLLTNYVVSTAVPTTNTNLGVSLRFTLAQ